MKKLSEFLIVLGITKETARRALRTFLQSAIGYVAANIVIVDFSSGTEVLKTALIGLAVSAIAAGIAAVMNIEKSEGE